MGQPSKPEEAQGFQQGHVVEDLWTEKGKWHTKMEVTYTNSWIGYSSAFAFCEHILSSWLHLID